MNVKTYEKVLQLDLFSTMPVIPLPPKRKHPHDVKFRKIVGLGLNHKNIRRTKWLYYS